MLTLQKVERNLQLPILNVCLAASAGKENDLREAKRMLVETVHDMLVTAAYLGNANKENKENDDLRNEIVMLKFNLANAERQLHELTLITR